MYPYEIPVKDLVYISIHKTRENTHTGLKYGRKYGQNGANHFSRWTELERTDSSELSEWRNFRSHSLAEIGGVAGGHLIHALN